MRLICCALLLTITLAVPLQKQQLENKQLRKTNSALLQALKELTSASDLQEEEQVGFGGYKCVARNNCISDCQEDDKSKSWYACMKECPKSLCEDDSDTDSVDPEESADSDEEAVGLTCEKDGVKGSVTSERWCDTRDVWMHKCSDCRHGYYWYWWHTYCCTSGKSGCTCAYN